MMNVKDPSNKLNQPLAQTQPQLPLLPEQVWQVLPILYRQKLIETLTRICRQLVAPPADHPSQQEREEVKKYDSQRC